MKLSKNQISLAGEFAVLSRLTLRGYDANLTLGNTKGVDILVSDPESDTMFKVEVKTNHQQVLNKPSFSKVHGKVVSGWIMHKKHETLVSPNLFYCFVNIHDDAEKFNFYMVPSKVVAAYVRDQHNLWLKEKKKEGKAVVNSDMRIFRLGIKTEKYPIETPLAERYENNWGFKN
ncbi:hypothetical protein CL652_02585 [bacterium]|nr:hypothetical protein [bacterium]|tara:strand:+ start:17429 stop:17950 length:522 start_codon:yes stop_codon:yes gene_type:complete